MKLSEQLKALEDRIKDSYVNGTTVEDAERLAAEFLHAQMLVSKALKSISLEARMKKQGVKAIRAAVYLDEVRKADKKPSDVLLGAMIDSNDLVSSEETAFHEAEEERDELERYYNIFRESHIYYRGIGKGRYE